MKHFDEQWFSMVTSGCTQGLSLCRLGGCGLTLTLRLALVQKKGCFSKVLLDARLFHKNGGVCLHVCRKTGFVSFHLEFVGPDLVGGATWRRLNTRALLLDLCELLYSQKSVLLVLCLKGTRIWLVESSPEPFIKGVQTWWEGTRAAGVRWL